MRFVFTLFFLMFTVLSCTEFFGGSFWLYRVINVLALVSLWIACRREPQVVPIAEELIELDDLDGLDDLDQLVDVEDAERMTPLQSV